MNLEHVRLRIVAIENEARKCDHEAAHMLEDALRHDVLALIASGSCEPETAAQLAREVMRTSEIKFHRWCA